VVEVAGHDLSVASTSSPTGPVIRFARQEIQVEARRSKEGYHRRIREVEILDRLFCASACW
jgi:hypothetical protein